MDKVKLTAIILTKNEERDLPDCLASLRDLAAEVYVIDSGSTDATAAIAQAAGAVVLQHAFDSHAGQMNWALENVPTGAEWLLRIDADERLSSEMREDLRRVIASAPPDIAGLLLARRTEFLGKKLRFGGTFPVWLLRVWRRGHGRCEDRWMDERMVVGAGRLLHLRGELLHVIPKSLAEWSAKHVTYAGREYLTTLGASTSGPSEHPGPVANAQSRLYYGMPVMLRVLGFWMYRYVLQLGFLDGKIGFLYHFLQCGWYRMLVDGIIIEARASRTTPAWKVPSKAPEQ